MRGKATGGNNHSWFVRITPAYAGKSLELVSIRSHIRDHPRLCGEKLRSAPAKPFPEGSPPPMRGKDGFEYFNVKQIRITPAYAGKSEEIMCVEVKPEDHPRLCGEKFISITVMIRV